MRGQGQRQAEALDDALDAAMAAADEMENELTPGQDDL